MDIFAIVSEQGPSQHSVPWVSVDIWTRPTYPTQTQTSGWKALSGDSYTPYAELEMKNITSLYVFVYWHSNDVDDIQYF